MLKRKIVLSGSLGNIGKSLATKLVSSGHEVTVITSKESNRKEIEAFGATAAVGSVENVGFLSNLYKTADAAFVLVPGNRDVNQVEYYRRVGSNFAQAIKESGVKRVVSISSYGAHLDKGTGFILGSYHLEQILNELSEVNDIELTHLRAGFFYPNFLAFIPFIKSQGTFMSNFTGESLIPCVHPSDIASVAAEELVKDKNCAKVLYVTSDDRTANDIANVIGNAIGVEMKEWKYISGDEFKSAVTRIGASENSANAYVETCNGIYSGRTLEHYKEYQKNGYTFGKIKLEQFAKEEFAPVYNSNN